MRGFTQRTPVAEALAKLDSLVARPHRQERVPITSALFRVLAETIISRVAVPSFDRSAMDGYAVSAADVGTATHETPRRLKIAGESLPGRPWVGSWVSGSAVRIMTGAPMPPGTDAVVPVEHASESEQTVAIREGTSRHRHVSRIGEDIAVGTRVLEAGRRLRPQDLALLASIEIAEVNVLVRPKVAMLVTGEELLPPGSKLEPFRIIDSNSVMLTGLVTRDGGIPLPPCYLPDRPELIREAIQTCDADVILVSGGSSVGREDYAPRLVAELGQLVVHGVAMRPAAPTGFGLLGEKPVFLLPGNPVACLCAYDLFAGFAIRRLGGLSEGLPYRAVELPARSNIPSAIGRLDYVRVKITEEGVEPIPMTGASILRSTVLADGFVFVPPERPFIPAGERVNVYRFDDTHGFG